MMPRAARSRVRGTRLVALLICALLICAGIACSEKTTGGERLLPESHVGLVMTGDPAGPAQRGAELVMNPFANDPVAVREGERLFREMNCADCHSYSGDGGMGPSLIDGEWLFGDTSADRFESVHNGRARGMPAYGLLLPDESIWQIVAYVEQLEQSGGEPRRAGGDAPGAARRSQQPAGGRH